MRTLIFASFLAIVSFVAVVDNVSAGPAFGEVGLSVGGVFPQGNYAKYADSGPTALIRATMHIPGVEAFGLWGSLSGAFFSSDTEPGYVDFNGAVFPAKQTTSEYVISLNLGLQLGSGTRYGAIRPRAAIGPGIYFFQTDRDLRLIDTEENLVEDAEGQAVFGWRGVLGVDLFPFSTRWGLNFSFVYDEVWNLQHERFINDNGDTVEISRAATFNTFMLGVVISFDEFAD